MKENSSIYIIAFRKELNKDVLLKGTLEREFINSDDNEKNYVINLCKESLKENSCNCKDNKIITSGNIENIFLFSNYEIAEKAFKYHKKHIEKFRINQNFIREKIKLYNILVEEHIKEYNTAIDNYNSLLEEFLNEK